MHLCRDSCSNSHCFFKANSRIAHRTAVIIAMNLRIVYFMVSNKQDCSHIVAFVLLFLHCTGRCFEE